MTTADELRDKVHRAIFFGDAKTTEERANAAIRTVLDAAIMTSVAHPDTSEHNGVYCLGHTHGINAKRAAIRALMPEDQK